MKWLFMLLIVVLPSTETKTGILVHVESKRVWYLGNFDGKEVVTYTLVMPEKQPEVEAAARRLEFKMVKV